MNGGRLLNFFSLAGAESVSKVLTFLAFAYMARTFGAAGYGYVEWAAAILMCASLVVDQGFSSYGAREIAKSPSRTVRLVAEIVTARILLAFAAYAGISALALLYVSDVALRNLILVFGASLWLLPFLLQWVFQGHDRMHLVSVTQIARQAVFAAVVFLFIGGVNDLFVVGIAELAGVAVAAGLSVILYSKIFSGKALLSPAFSKDTFRSGGTIGLSQLFWVVKMFGATVIVGMIATAGETGTFAAAMRVFIALHTFVWLYFFNLLPALSRAWSAEHGEFSKLVAESMRVVLYVAVPACAVGLVAAPYLMGVVYGPDFAAGGGALRWLGLACLFAAISGHFRFGLIASGFQSREMVSSAVGALVAVILIPAGYFIGGITYAALGLCLAEASILLTSWLQARDILAPRNRAVTRAPDNEALTGLPQSAR